MLYLSLFIFPFPFVLLCSIQLIVTKPTSSLVAHPCCLLSRSYFSLFLLFFFYSHSTRCSFPLHIVTWIHIIGLSVGELSSQTVTFGGEAKVSNIEDIKCINSTSLVLQRSLGFKCELRRRKLVNE